ncbi:hypothetical protein Tco_0833158 [Tanacetum coccineum]
MDTSTGKEYARLQEPLEDEPYKGGREGTNLITIFELHNKAVKARVSRSRIDIITNSLGNVFENDQVATAFVDHYTTFLGQADTLQHLDTNDLFYARLLDQDAANMVCDITTKEVKDAMFSMGNDKSPGPDGYTAAFFKDAWEIVGSDVVNAVKEFFVNGKLLKELNHTVIALIPKIQNPTRINDFRPISSRWLTSPRLCVFKVVIQKAYDTVDWGFLKSVLIGFGFHEKMDRSRDYGECVSASITLLLILNGSLSWGNFKGKRGLRQGDPLSPYLFTMVMEVLTLILRRKIRNSDDFSFLEAFFKRVIMEALNEFKFTSGLVPSLPKSTAYFCNVLNYTKIAILQIMPFEEGSLPVEGRINDWKNKSLSIAGRLQLIHSVIASLHVYWASMFVLPSRVLLDIEQSMRGFLWCQGKMRKGKSKVAWEDVCLPRMKVVLVSVVGYFTIKLLCRLHLEAFLLVRTSWWVKSDPDLNCGIAIFGTFHFEVLWTWGSWRKILQLVRDLHRVGLTTMSKVRDIIHDGSLSWPADLEVKYPILNSTTYPHVFPLESDKLEWRFLGAVDAFSVF